MEAFPSLALEPPSGSHSDLVFQAIHSPFGVSLSLEARGGALRDVLCFGCGVLFFHVVWFDIKNIVKFIKFSLQMTF